MSPSQPPPGDPAPPDGALPAASVHELADGTFSFYIHVPFCATRCGYCDFNTYTAEELGSEPGASRASYADAVITEIELAARVCARASGQLPTVSTVFFGGGTPTLLPAADLVRILAAIESRFGLAADAEVTTEANPESVTQGSLAELVAGGFNRISFGMQSSVPHVLQILERQHRPERIPEVVAWARAAGFTSISLDLIYGTPGETAEDWQLSLDAAIGCRPDHLSAYSLIVEDGTRLAAQIRRGEVAMIDDDLHAERYLQAEETLTHHGFQAYEVSNWATGPEHQCRHNLAYWRGGHWWGAGPGAHSHVGGVRWWNQRHPAPWAAALAQGLSGAQAREILDADTRRIEHVMLEMRLLEGLSRSWLTQSEQRRMETHIAAGRAHLVADRYVLTLAGRLVADGIVRDILD